MASWKLTDRQLDLASPIGAGIVNVTDDSMFEGARSGTPERAIEDGLAARRVPGFEMLDVGAVAARSGPPVPAEEEAARLVPAIEGLAARTELPISADTFSSEVARRSLEAGAVAINDIAGGSEAMLELAAETGCGLVVMQIEGPPREDREPPRYDDPVDHLKGWFTARLEAAARRGVDDEQIALDPGLDFDLSVDDDLEILRTARRAQGARSAALRLALAQGLPRGGAGRLLGGATAGERSRVGDRRCGGPGGRRPAPTCCGCTT